MQANSLSLKHTLQYFSMFDGWNLDQVDQNQSDSPNQKGFIRTSSTRTSSTRPVLPGAVLPDQFYQDQFYQTSSTRPVRPDQVYQTSSTAQTRPLTLLPTHSPLYFLLPYTNSSPPLSPPYAHSSSLHSPAGSPSCHIVDVLLV